MQAMHTSAAVLGVSPEFMGLVVVPWIILMLTYWLVGGAFLLLDWTPWIKSIILNRKCQPKTHPSGEMVKDIVKTVLPQQLTIYPLALLASYQFLSGFIDCSPELPSAYQVVISIPALVLCAEFWFFYNHWMLHHPKLYPLVHKVHHKYTSPIALECLYFHPVESMLNLGVVGMGPILMKSHCTVLWVWEFAALLAILLHHSGYDVPYDGVPGVLNSMSHFHDFHHQNYRVNFGVLGILDRLHGTDKGYDVHVDKWEAQRSKALDGQAEEKKK